MYLKQKLTKQAKEELPNVVNDMRYKKQQQILYTNGHDAVITS